MRGFSKLIDTFIHIILVTALSLIVILVFSNVVLRYIFGSGIIWSQELSRYLFVWMTFIGAIIAFKHNDHLAINMVVKRLPGFYKKIAVTLNYLIILFILALIFHGSWKMTVLNFDSTSPATGLPLSIIYVSGLLVSLGMGVMILINLIKLLTNKVKADDLIMKE